MKLLEVLQVTCLVCDVRTEHVVYVDAEPVNRIGPLLPPTVLPAGPGAPGAARTTWLECQVCGARERVRRVGAAGA